MAFGSFQQGGAPLDMTSGSGLMSGMGPLFSQAGGSSAHLHSVLSNPMLMGDTSHGAPAARLASPATGGTSHQEWVGQFAGMQLGSGTAAAGPSMTAMHPAAHHMQHAPAMPQQPLSMNLQSTPFGMPMYSAPTALSGFQFPGALQHQQPQQSLASPLPDSAVDMDVEAFNRAFGEYDDAHFQSELADWTQQQQQQSLANTEFAEAQDAWMAQHGPQVGSSSSKEVTAEEASAAPAETAQPPTAAEMEVIDARLEQLAQEQDDIHKRQSDEELARAAASIVRSVAGNTSDKFRNSRFLELMRRIGNREVVVQGDSGVDAETGEAVRTAEEGDGNGEGKGVEGGGGDPSDGTATIPATGTGTGTATTVAEGDRTAAA
jgi:hypothetical protein